MDGLVGNVGADYLVFAEWLLAAKRACTGEAAPGIHCRTQEASPRQAAAAAAASATAKAAAKRGRTPAGAAAV